MLILMLGVNGAIEANVFLSSISIRVNERVNAEAWCEWALRLRNYPLIKA